MSRHCRMRCAGLNANLVPDAPQRGSTAEADGTAFEDEEQDGLENLAAGAAAFRFERDLRLLEVRQGTHYKLYPGRPVGRECSWVWHPQSLPFDVYL